MPNETEAQDVSLEGDVIIGDAYLQAGTEAWIWYRQCDGPYRARRVSDLLCQNGVDLGDWNLQYGVGVSDDGTVIVGYGTHPEPSKPGRDVTEAWVAVLPEPPTW